MDRRRHNFACCSVVKYIRKYVYKKLARILHVIYESLEHDIKFVFRVYEYDTYVDWCTVILSKFVIRFVNLAGSLEGVVLAQV